MRIGLIQTRGIGDIVIAAPIAMYFIRQGHEVFWPIDSEFIEAFSYALPEIQFLPVDKAITGTNTAEYFVEFPKRLLEHLSCERVHVLYSYLTGYDFGRSELSEAISFDAYKYAVTEVPLLEKWSLKIKRNPLREAELFNKLALKPSDNYLVCHEQGTVYHHNFTKDFEKNQIDIRVVKILEITNNFFDWLGVLENCIAFYGVNSVYLNIVDQLNIDCNKYFKPQTTSKWTPVLKNDWIYL